MEPLTPPRRPSGRFVSRLTKGTLAIIMAGGRGERFWPVSREKTPKQLIKLLGEKSFLQEAVANVLPVDVEIAGCPPEPVELLRGILRAVQRVRNPSTTIPAHASAPLPTPPA